VNWALSRINTTSAQSWCLAERPGIVVVQERRRHPVAPHRTGDRYATRRLCPRLRAPVHHRRARMARDSRAWRTDRPNSETRLDWRVHRLVLRPGWYRRDCRTDLVHDRIDGDLDHRGRATGALLRHADVQGAVVLARVADGLAECGPGEHSPSKDRLVVAVHFVDWSGYWPGSRWCDCRPGSRAAAPFRPAPGMIRRTLTRLRADQIGIRLPAGTRWTLQRRTI
jgi:hypothetical protein